jgi:hypothetical protein
MGLKEKKKPDDRQETENDEDLSSSPWIAGFSGIIGSGRNQAVFTFLTGKLSGLNKIMVIS